ncbi:MAG: hypothetical protein ACJAVR_003855 [Paracoccaceae bacterium]|jgi:hypothetical protein
MQTRATFGLTPMIGALAQRCAVIRKLRTQSAGKVLRMPPAHQPDVQPEKT